MNLENVKSLDAKVNKIIFVNVETEQPWELNDKSEAELMKLRDELALISQWIYFNEPFPIILNSFVDGLRQKINKAILEIDKMM